MKIMPLILLCVLINAAAQLLLKAGMNRIGEIIFSWSNLPSLAIQILTNPFVLLGLFCYVVAVTLWLFVLSRTDVGMAYPMISLAYIVTAIAAYYFFHEDLSMLRIVGIGTIMLGVYLIAQT